MVAMTGWTWDQVRDQLDLPRVELMQVQWKKNPPLAVTMRLAAEALGVEFTGGSLAKPDQAPKAEFDPIAAMAEYGLVEGPAYVRPQMGMPLGN
jgi:hypothetical protein